MIPTLRLKPGHVRPVWTGHPWVFAQAVAAVEGQPAPGDEVLIVDPKGNPLGRALYSPGSALVARIHSRDPDAAFDGPWLRARVDGARALRVDAGLPTADTTGYRALHAEGDGVPGLVVDCFGDVLVVQLNTIGLQRRRELVVRTLVDAFAPRAIVDRTSSSSAQLEGFALGAPASWGAVPDALTFRERGFEFRIPMELAQKTGFYFDQRELRGRVERLGAGRRVLDAFSFVGPLGLAAARGGATGVLAVDESRAALDVARETFARHGFGSVFDARPGEARAVLRELAADARFDLVVLDPPKLAPRRKTREGALDVYAQLAQLGARLVRDGGYLVLCSCSGAVDLNALTRQLADGVARAHADATVVERVLQGADHPVHAAFPEGLYLKALIARIGRRPGTVATQGRDP